VDLDQQQRNTTKETVNKTKFLHRTEAQVRGNWQTHWCANIEKDLTTSTTLLLRNRLTTANLDCLLWTG